jgi:signal peptidase complex subunit 1
MADFRGQRLSERLGQALVTAFAVASFLLGWWRGSFALAMYVFAAGVAVAAAATVPDWPAFNRAPVAFLPPRAPPPPPVRPPRRARASYRNLWGWLK